VEIYTHYSDLKNAQAATASYASRWGKEKDLRFRSTKTNKD
jgi:hypothetical protein